MDDPSPYRGRRIPRRRDTSLRFLLAFSGCIFSEVLVEYPRTRASSHVGGMVGMGGGLLDFIHICIFHLPQHQGSPFARYGGNHKSWVFRHVSVRIYRIYKGDGGKKSKFLLLSLLFNFFSRSFNPIPRRRQLKKKIIINENEIKVRGGICSHIRTYIYIGLVYGGGIGLIKSNVI